MDPNVDDRAVLVPAPFRYDRTKSRHDEIDAEREMLRTAFSQRELVNLQRWQ